MLDSKLKEKLANDRDNEVLLTIKEITEEEDWYKHVSTETALNILKDLEIDQKYYLELLSK